MKDTTKTTTGYLIRTRSQTGTEQDKIKETIATKTMAATKDEVEALLREYRNNKPRSAEPGVFTDSISKNAREWLITLRVTQHYMICLKKNNINIFSTPEGWSETVF